MTLTDFPALHQLSREEKLQLVADLWDHIAGLPEEAPHPISPAEAALLDQRLAAHRADPDGAMSLEEFKRRLNARS